MLSQRAYQQFLQDPLVTSYDTMQLQVTRATGISPTLPCTTFRVFPRSCGMDEPSSVPPMCRSWPPHCPLVPALYLTTAALVAFNDDTDWVSIPGPMQEPSDEEGKWLVHPQIHETDSTDEDQITIFTEWPITPRNITDKTRPTLSQEAYEQFLQDETTTTYKPSTQWHSGPRGTWLVFPRQSSREDYSAIPPTSDQWPPSFPYVPVLYLTNTAYADFLRDSTVTSSPCATCSTINGRLVWLIHIKCRLLGGGRYRKPVPFTRPTEAPSDYTGPITYFIRGSPKDMSHLQEALTVDMAPSVLLLESTRPNFAHVTLTNRDSAKMLTDHVENAAPSTIRIERAKQSENQASTSLVVFMHEEETLDDLPDKPAATSGEVKRILEFSNVNEAQSVLQHLRKTQPHRISHFTKTLSSTERYLIVGAHPSSYPKTIPVFQLISSTAYSATVAFESQTDALEAQQQLPNATLISSYQSTACIIRVNTDGLNSPPEVVMRLGGRPPQFLALDSTRYYLEYSSHAEAARALTLIMRLTNPTPDSVSLVPRQPKAFFSKLVTCQTMDDEADTIDLLERAVAISGAKESHVDDGLIWLTFTSHDEAVAALYTLGSTDRLVKYSLTRRPNSKAGKPSAPSTVLYVPHAQGVNILTTLGLGGEFVSATTNKKGMFTLVIYTSTVESTAALAAIRKVIPKAAFSRSTAKRDNTTLEANILHTDDESAACATAESAEAVPQQSQTLDSAAFTMDSSSSDGESYSTPDEDESKPQTTDDQNATTRPLSVRR